MTNEIGAGAGVAYAVALALFQRPTPRVDGVVILFPVWVGMKTFKRISSIVLTLLVALLALLFILENQQGVVLTLLGWETVSLPLAIPLILAFLLGLLVGPVLGWLAYGRLLLRVRAQGRALERQKRELQKDRVEKVTS